MYNAKKIIVVANGNSDSVGDVLPKKTNLEVPMDDAMIVAVLHASHKLVEKMARFVRR